MYIRAAPEEFSAVKAQLELLGPASPTCRLAPTAGPRFPVGAGCRASG